MGKRGPRSKVSPEMIARIKELYTSGSTHCAISKELGISQTNIRRILKLNGTPKRTRKLATLLTPQEEDLLVQFLSSIGYFPGKYRELKALMEHFANENQMKCPFTYSWRDGFVRRHGKRLPHHIVKLLSPKLQRADDFDAELDYYSHHLQAQHSSNGLPQPGMIQIQPQQKTAATSSGAAALHEAGLFPNPDPTKEPSVWRPKPKLTTAERAVRDSVRAFVRAGLTREEAVLLLQRLKVPESLLATLSKQSSDVVAAALTDALGEGSSGAQQQQPAPTTAGPSTSSAAVPRPAEPAQRPRPPKKAAVKKTPLQIELLEKAFAKSQTCGDKRAKKLAKLLGLTPAQIIYWFHNTARFRRKKLTIAVYEQLTEETETGGEVAMDSSSEGDQIQLVTTTGGNGDASEDTLGQLEILVLPMIHQE